MLTHLLGFPRIGSQRELKRSLELYWAGSINQEELQATAEVLKTNHWKIIADAGIDLIPIGDNALYDHILDTTTMLGLIPPRFSNEVGLDRYFSMARGNAEKGLSAMEMTKWFDTNYHFIVPEFSSDLKIELNYDQLLEDVLQAKALGYQVKPVLVGPITYLSLGKEIGGFDRWKLLPQLITAYQVVIKTLSEHCDWIQIDEPILVTDLKSEVQAKFATVYQSLKAVSGDTKLILTTYFESVGENLETTLDLPCDAFHFDLVRGKDQLNELLEKFPKDKIISLGLIDGRNIWKTDLDEAQEIINQAVDKLGSSQVLIGSSCSLLHCPVDLKSEQQLDSPIYNWLSFSVQKCREVALLRLAFSGKDVDQELKEHAESISDKANHPLTFNQAVRNRVSKVTESDLEREHRFELRKPKQLSSLNLPNLPTTTIGSFPQTPSIRKVRLDYKLNRISKTVYETQLKEVIAENVKIQEELELDVLVHGEPERNDMVEYFGQQLKGFCFTSFGWVQSYGSRCVKPPIIYGDVSRPNAMTVDWIKYAASLTEKPMKGMLTGPVTILCWSFLRNDLTRQEVCQQIALAIRDEVQDLEMAGIKVIQVDEAAFREGMPLQKSKQESYLNWAVDSFRLTVSGVEDCTQIHTHMCYSNFNAVARWIAKMDADVISIEASRSDMKLLESFKTFPYPNDIGPGVYDIHSPRVPSTAEQLALLHKALEVITPDKLWVNPDCGLKTRKWPETLESLKNMVAAAKQLRNELN
ncbi:MAG: 5-methyltetrahydropteroyltriglutamate--homocysteine S-methyltransferase [Lentisphaeria bacterium]|nr:5-methyltetrahydropteroyltriglutamate--homocysteine S-methyltransferase [Lentisphaeria bacterium]